MILYVFLKTRRHYIEEKKLNFPKCECTHLLYIMIFQDTTIPAVKQILLETLRGLSEKDQKKFSHFLQLTYFQKGLPQFPPGVFTHNHELVDLMVQFYSEQSVELTKEVLMDMNSTDTVKTTTQSKTNNSKITQHCFSHKCLVKGLF